MILSILARTISIEALLFLIFLFMLYLLFHAPLQNFLRKLLNKRKTWISSLVEILFLLIGARILALYTEPFVSQFVERIVEVIINSLSMLQR